MLAKEIKTGVKLRTTWGDLEVQDVIPKSSTNEYTVVFTTGRRHTYSGDDEPVLAISPPPATLRTGDDYRRWEAEQTKSYSTPQVEKNKEKDND